MKTMRRFAVILLALSTVACISADARDRRTEAVEKVFEAERAFAATMAERDFAAFADFIDEEAVFIEEPHPLQGKLQVLDAWRGYFEAPEAPFSWAPDQVEVLASGTLAHSSGPVFDASGTAVARFNSIWRLNARGEWKVVFDKGSPLED